MHRKCGGCLGLGAHIRWCPRIVGHIAAIRGHQSEQAEALADSVGANNPEAANLLYVASAMLLSNANELKQQFQQRTPGHS